jgi:hypothetical protein
MKSIKQIGLSLLIIFTLSSFGLINNSDLLHPIKRTIQTDSLQTVQSKKATTTQISVEEIQQKEINKQEQEEDKSNLSLANQIGYFFILGIKSLLTFVLKLFTF